MERRTEEQIRAYVDGYKDCYQQFCECLKGRKNVPEAVKKMELFRDTVVKVVGEEE